MSDDRHEVPLGIATAGEGLAGPWSAPVPFPWAGVVAAVRQVLPRRRRPAVVVGAAMASGGGA